MKEFKGVIKNSAIGKYVIGDCVWHVDPKLIGPGIHTSAVVSVLHSSNGWAIVETANSYYLVL